jgi:hypothetical protein
MYSWKKSKFQYECAIKLQHVLNERVHSIQKEMICFLVTQPYFDPLSQFLTNSLWKIWIITLIIQTQFMGSLQVFSTNIFLNNHYCSKSFAHTDILIQ